MRIQVTYDRVTFPVSKVVPCRGCGKSLKRSTTFGQTINPFNKNAAGQVKDVYEINAELREQAKAWHPKNDICATCAAVTEA